MEFAYDYQGRMIRRTVWDGSSGSYVVTEDLKYAYDGFRCMAELNVSGGALVRSYIWGLDLSGSMDGVGGVGGLLGVHMHDTAMWHFPFYDGNGNVAGLVNGTTGAISANYEYDPFGKIIGQTGAVAEQNRFRFSTKYTDNETDLIYYGYRFYNASTGRWLSRDPIDEQGGQNLYAFGNQDPVDYVDAFGLLIVKPIKERVGDLTRAWAAAETHSDISYQKIEEDCSCGKRITKIEYTIESTIIYANATSQHQKLNGISIRDHEMIHVRKDENSAKDREKKLKSLVGKCRSAACMAATESYITALNTYYQNKVDYSHSLFDLTAYSNSNNEDTVREDAGRARKAMVISEVTMKQQEKAMNLICEDSK